MQLKIPSSESNFILQGQLIFTYPQ